MAYVIAEPCIGQKDNSCVEVCPVDCIHPTPDEADYDKVEMLYIDPEECIDCDACVEACPVDACFAEDQLPEEWNKYIQINADYYKPEGGRLARAPSAAGCRSASGSAAGSGCGGATETSPRAVWKSACEAGASGSESTSGRPSSAPTRSSSWSGTFPSSGTSSSSASCWPPPSPKIVKRSPLGRREARHVLDHARDLEVEAARRLGRALSDLLRGRLRRRDDHELRLRQELRERHRDVAGARRQVDQQVVELAPLDVLEELADRLVEHRPAPGDRLVAALEEELDRHDPDAVVDLERKDLPLGRHHRLAVHAHHARDRVAPHVGVERGRAVALRMKRRGQVGRDGRLADPALARADADHVADARERAGRQRAAAQALLERLLLVMRRGRRSRRSPS